MKDKDNNTTLSKKRRRDDAVNNEIVSFESWMNGLVSLPSVGHILFDLLNSIDTRSNKKDSNLNLFTRMEKVVSILQRLVLSCQRVGTLQGNLEAAEHVLSSSGSSTEMTLGATAGGSMDKMRKNKRGSSRNKKHNNINDENSTDVKRNGLMSTLDPNRILSSIMHILESNTYLMANEPTRDTDVTMLNSYRLMILALAADACTSCSEFVKTQHGEYSDIIICAEYEILASSGKSLLTGIEKRIREISASMEKPELSEASANEKKKKSSVRRLPSAFDDPWGNAMFALLRASASLVSLFGTKLSRSVGLISRLREVAWKSLLTVVDYKRNDKHSISRASGILLSTLSLTGGVESQSTCQTWNQCFSECISFLSKIVDFANPVANRKDSQGNSNTGLVDSAGKQQMNLSIVNQWIADLGAVKSTLNERCDTQPRSESELVTAFLYGVEGLTELAGSLLSNDHVSLRFPIGHQTTHFEVDLEALIALIEKMITIVSSAEASYYTTKKRLRTSVIESQDGCLTFSAAVLTGISKRIKVHGLKLFQAFLISVGGSGVLLPYGPRISALAYNVLLTSSSSAVQLLVDPTRLKHAKYGKKNRDLPLSHTCLVVRRMAIELFREVITHFGTNIATIKLSNSLLRIGDNLQGNELERAVTIVCSCIVEQLSRRYADSSEDCGSIDERVQLVSTSFVFLETCLMSVGEFLPETSRNLIDSTLDTQLRSIQSGSGHPVLFAGATKASVIEAATVCICTPWHDGSSSEIINTLRKSANCCLHDRDRIVSSATLRAVGICNALASPCAPVIRRLTNESSRSLERIGFGNLTAADNLRNDLIQISKEISSVKRSQELNVRNEELEKKKLRLLNSNESPHESQVAIGEVSIVLNDAIEGANRSQNFNKKKVEVEVAVPIPITCRLEFDRISGTDVEANTTNFAGEGDVLDLPRLPLREGIDEDDDVMPTIVDCDPDEADSDD